MKQKAFKCYYLIFAGSTVENTDLDVTIIADIIIFDATIW